MSTRMLLILGLVCIMIAGYFYRSGDSTLVNLNLKPSDIDYQANNIKAIQTDNTGNIHYQMIRHRRNPLRKGSNRYFGKSQYHIVSRQ